MIELEEQEAFNAKAILVEPRTLKEDPITAQGRMNELESLCHTLGLEVCTRFPVTIRSVKAASLIGSGKIEEIIASADENNAKIVVFDFDLTPTMQMNLERQTNLCVIDRQEVIIQIFADRAQTSEAKIQVELARLEYSLPRLARKWTNLSQTRGGVRGGKGSGEKQLELDRRYVEKRITVLKQDLEKVKRCRSTQRQGRMDNRIPKIAIVGYTNSGKSTLLNALTSSSVLEENKLFATLDPVTRRMVFSNGSQALLTDTVGFINNLPHSLIDSFRSTLEEAALADLLIIVCDATHPNLTGCFMTTEKVLEELGCKGKEQLILLNKMDAATEEQQFLISRFCSEVQKQTGEQPLKVSVKTGENIDVLIAQIQTRIQSGKIFSEYHIPLSEHALIDRLRTEAQIMSIRYEDTMAIVCCYSSPETYARYSAYLASKNQKSSSSS
ncbi:MAG: GTPase HflX [Sphaerochaetaceae bacterium]|jgi:GTPase|nr:GTPase HflX [Sphaerochaetaceae bacterium]NLY08067.1 GTPase HflX [Spirochaetales bacterium]